MRDTEDMGLIPGSGRAPGEGHGNTLQYSDLNRGQNPMDRVSSQATVHGVTKNQKRLKCLSTTQHVVGRGTG